MKSRRRIAGSLPRATPTMACNDQLQQGFAADEMGFNDKFALQKS
jgi:hypothetical protein